MAKKPKGSFDFAGWATRFNIKCSDGRTIKNEAFMHHDGMTVPLVWGHKHNDIDNVLGHALLEFRENEGIYTYGSFNSTDEGKRAKEMVSHGDITALSIYANKLKHKGSDVVHGEIKEVSLVLAGANPGAHIETVLAHSEDEGDEAVIFNVSDQLFLEHSDQQDDEEKNPKEDTKVEKTVQQVFDEFSEEQKNVVYAMIGLALEEGGKKTQEEDTMKQNLFNNTQQNDEESILKHEEVLEAIKDAKKVGSLKTSFLEHGITDVSQLFPETQAVNRTPETISRDMNWVQKVMSKVKHSPFSRVKSTAVNLTADEAKAKGYIKGDQKAEQVIVALKRSTTPQTIYINQKMDRDDVVDITDFDVVAFLKSEMRILLDEEIARAILIGDGRLASDEHKIKADNVRPILGDNAVYTVPKIMEPASGESEYAFAKRLIKEIIKARKDYKGSGNPDFFTTEDMLTNMLLIEDTNGRVIYETVDRLKTALRVSDIITVPVMENVVRTNDASTFDYTCLGILVNLNDYNVGADKGGAVSMFEDFDIDYNKEKYLIETRISGALIKPYSAISFELKTNHVAG